MRIANNAYICTVQIINIKQLLALVFLASVIASGNAQQGKDRHHDVVTNRETVKQTENLGWIGIGAITIKLYVFESA